MLVLLDGLHDGQENFHGNIHSESEEEAQLLTRGDKGAPGVIDSLVSSEEDMELVRKWTAVMGPSYEIKVGDFVQDLNVYSSLPPLSLCPPLPPCSIPHTHVDCSCSKIQCSGRSWDLYGEYCPTG